MNRAFWEDSHLPDTQNHAPVPSSTLTFRTPRIWEGERKGNSLGGTGLVEEVVQGIYSLCIQVCKALWDPLPWKGLYVCKMCYHQVTASSVLVRGSISSEDFYLLLVSDALSSSRSLPSEASCPMWHFRSKLSSVGPEILWHCLPPATLIPFKTPPCTAQSVQYEWQCLVNLIFNSFILICPQIFSVLQILLLQCVAALQKLAGWWFHRIIEY